MITEADIERVEDIHKSIFNGNARQQDSADNYQSRKLEKFMENTLECVLGFVMI